MTTKVGGGLGDNDAIQITAEPLGTRPHSKSASTLSTSVPISTLFAMSLPSEPSAHGLAIQHLSFHTPSFPVSVRIPYPFCKILTLDQYNTPFSLLLHLSG